MYKTYLNNDDILAITTNRLNGYSDFPYNSFNMAFHVGDVKEDVERNYQLLCKELNINYDNIHLPNQTHSDVMIEVTHNNQVINEECDALFTKSKNIYLGVLTADCCPILVYDTKNKIVAAIHAGWVGSVKLITYKSIKYLIEHEQLSPKHTKVFIAPCIKKRNYEVGQDVFEAVMKYPEFYHNDLFSSLKNDKYLYDNTLFNYLQILACDIPKTNIFVDEDCTFENSDYFSYRRDRKCGRQLTLIGMR